VNKCCRFRKNHLIVSETSSPAKTGRRSSLISGGLRWISWLLCAVIVVVLVILVLDLKGQSANSSLIRRVDDTIAVIFPIVYAAVAALIIYNQPYNVIGWLLMSPAFFFPVSILVGNTLASFTTAPQATFPNLLMTWFDNWSWLPLIFPLPLLMLLFPTGKPPSPRWRWVLYLALGMCVFLVVMVTFSPQLKPQNSTWGLTNPVALIPAGAAQFIERIILPPWFFGLILLNLACFISLFVRYRNAPPVEREQIKWLLFAAGLFASAYIVAIVFNYASQNGSWASVTDLLIFLTAMFLPIAIGIAILRYRLWDIDIIIRKTLVYTVLTGILGLVYYGSVAILQELLGRMSGVANLPLVIVISTLMIAALFTPVRRWVQNGIDRRFYRRKYDAQHILERFAASVRDEVELDQLSDHLLQVVDETLHPESYSLWQIPAKKQSSID
jgi:hypothetical protein